MVVIIVGLLFDGDEPQPLGFRFVMVKVAT